VKRYEIGGVKYVLHDITVGALTGVHELLEGVSLSEASGVMDVVKRLASADVLPKLLALVLAEEGELPPVSLSEVPAARIDAMRRADVTTAYEVARDFFTKRPGYASGIRSILAGLEALPEGVRMLAVAALQGALDSNGRSAEDTPTDTETSADSGQ
jgi:hypothetical protein